ncbi:MAG: hypothetical protein R3E39_15800 [Anaerolineae bacterium]
MILLRSVFHCKLGKVADVVAYFKAMQGSMTPAQAAALQPRMLTDISGRFDTLVLESTHESLAALEQFRAAFLNQPNSEPSPVQDLVVEGYNEYWTIET